MSLGSLIRSTLALPKHPRLVAAGTTPGGKVLIWLMATILLCPDYALLVSPLLALIILMPQRRNAILSVGSLWVLYAFIAARGVVEWPLIIALALAILAMTYGFFRTARSFDSLPRFLQSRPQIVLHAFVIPFAILAFLASRSMQETHPSLGRGLIVLATLLPFLVWRWGYLLMAGRRGTAKATSFVDHLFYCLPAYGGPSAVPYGKGHDYLERCRVQAQDRQEDLARVQLSGLKLLIMAWAWRAINGLIFAGIHGETAPSRAASLFEKLFDGRSLEIPLTADLIAGQPGAGVGIGVAWASLILELITRTLSLAILGHFVIGCLRLFGFNVFRNTYKPLLSQSIVEFWNRYYYYFKELLVEFFFFPTYVRYFKTRPKLRIFAATLMAAFVGNTYYHAISDLHNLLPMDFAGIWGRLAPRAFYAFLLAIGIFISMTREQNRRGTVIDETTVGPLSNALHTTRKIAGVWIFFSIIHIWSIPPVALTFSQRTTFFLSLFGIHTG